MAAPIIPNNAPAPAPGAIKAQTGTNSISSVPSQAGAAGANYMNQNMASQNANLQSGLNSIAGGYQQGLGSMQNALNASQNTTSGQMAQAQQQYQNQSGQATQNAYSRGLGNSTVMSSMQQQPLQTYNMNMNNIQNAGAERTMGQYDQMGNMQVASGVTPAQYLNQAQPNYLGYSQAGLGLASPYGQAQYGQQIGQQQAVAANNQAAAANSQSSLASQFGGGGGSAGGGAGSAQQQQQYNSAQQSAQSNGGFLDANGNFVSGASNGGGGGDMSQAYGGMYNSQNATPGAGQTVTQVDANGNPVGDSWTNVQNATPGAGQTVTQVDDNGNPVLPAAATSGGAGAGAAGQAVSSPAATAGTVSWNGQQLPMAAAMAQAGGNPEALNYLQSLA